MCSRRMHIPKRALTYAAAHRQEHPQLGTGRRKQPKAHADSHDDPQRLATCELRDRAALTHFTRSSLAAGCGCALCSVCTCLVLSINLKHCGNEFRSVCTGRIIVRSRPGPAASTPGPWPCLAQPGHWLWLGGRRGSGTARESGGGLGAQRKKRTREIAGRSLFNRLLLYC